VRALTPTPRRLDRLEILLVPLDGTPVAERAIEPAMHLARAHGSRVHLLYVIESLWAAGDSKLARDQLKEVRRVSDRLRELAAELRAQQLQARALIVRGDPSVELLAHAARYSVDLIVMTPSSASDRPAMFGHVSEKVLRASPLPILVIRKPASK
jgi:nucleotide-binding universal stress UspA family protein